MVMRTPLPPLDRLGAATRWVAAFGVPGAAGPEAGETAPLRIDDTAWSRWLGRLGWHRLTGIAVAAGRAGGLDLSAGQWDELLDRHRGEMVWSLRLDARLRELAAALDAAGVPFVVLKGPALAYVQYPDPSWRPYADLDLLVRRADRRAATRVLSRFGMRRSLPEPRPGYDDRFGKAVVYRAADGIEIDLHRMLAPGAFGLWMDPEELFGSTRTFEVGQTTLRRLDGTAALLHACVHAVLGDAELRLLSLRDIAQLAHGGEVEWDRLRAWGERWRVASVVRHAFAEVERHLEVGCAPDGFDPGRSDPAAERAFAAYRGGRHRGASARTTLAAVPGVRDKAAYVVAMLVPRREFLAARTGGIRGSYLARWTVALRWFSPRAARRATPRGDSRSTPSPARSTQDAINGTIRGRRET